MFKFFLMFLTVSLLALPSFGQSAPVPTNSAAIAASAINAIGLDLLRVTRDVEKNALLSPYSIETALAMAYTGADGKTREEMARVLHLGGENADVAGAFATLQGQLDGVVRNGERAADEMKKYSRTNEPMALNVANRLFGEMNYSFRPAFLDLLKTNFNAPLELMDFVRHSTAATKAINDWVAGKTKNRIRDLVPSGALSSATRLVLVNALYFKANWTEPFPEKATQPLPFHSRGGDTTNVPTMSIERNYGYAKTDGVTVVSVPYAGSELQFLIILPDDMNGLASVEVGLTAEKLAKWANLPTQNLKLFLPKFKMQPPTMMLENALQKLGMTTAFDNPRGSANFDRMAPRKPDDYLYISKVLHKTFINIDENGTEAAAATAVAMVRRNAMARPIEAVEVKVDHPFIFAIQHRSSGACLFLGQVVDPR